MCRQVPCGLFSSLGPWDRWIPPDLHGLYRWVFDSLEVLMTSLSRLSSIVGMLGFASGPIGFGRIGVPGRMPGLGQTWFLLLHFLS